MFPDHRNPDVHLRHNTPHTSPLLLFIFPGVSPKVVFIKMDFPTDVAEFDSDPRISFSRLDNSFLLETNDRREFLFNSILKRWVETVCNKRFRMLTYALRWTVCPQCRPTISDANLNCDFRSMRRSSASSRGTAPTTAKLKSPIRATVRSERTRMMGYVFRSFVTACWHW